MDSLLLGGSASESSAGAGWGAWDTFLPLMWTSASLSIVGELSLVAYYCFVPGDRSFFMKLVMYMSLIMLGGSATWFTNMPDPSQALCISGAVLSTFFYVSTFLWSCCIGIAMIQETRGNEASGKAFEKAYLAVCILVPLACTMIPLILGLYSIEIVEFEVGCWFTESWARIVFFDGWIFFSWCTNVLLLVVLQREFKKVANYLKLTPMSSETTEDKRRIFISIVLSFILCWFWSLLLAIFAIMRDFETYLDPHATFPVAVLFVIFAPLQGFLNFLAFMVQSRTFRQNYTDMWRRLFCFPLKHQASYPHTSTDAFLAGYAPYQDDEYENEAAVAAASQVPTTPRIPPSKTPAQQIQPAPSMEKYENALATSNHGLSASFEAMVNGDGGIVPSAVLPRVARTISTASSVVPPTSPGANGAISASKR